MKHATVKEAKIRNWEKMPKKTNQTRDQLDKHDVKKNMQKPR